MPSRKINTRTFSHRKKDLLKSIGSVVIAMRLCKQCSSADKICTLDKISEKCVACVEFGKSCDLAISSSKLRRIHKKRLRVRDAVRKAKTKLYYLRNQLRRLENKKEKIIFSEWDVINILKNKKEASSMISELSFDILSENFQFSESLDWSPFIAGLLNLNETGNVVAANENSE